MDEPILDLEGLQALTTPQEVEAVRGLMERMERDTELMLFVEPGCRACPHQVRAVATVTLASPHVALEIIDVSLEPELAAQYEIRAVPTTVVDDELVMVGVMPAQELAWRLVERQGPEAERLVFGALVGSGRHTDAAERLSDGRVTEVFLDLWAGNELEGRMALLHVAAEALLLDPTCLDELEPRMLAALEAELRDPDPDVAEPAEEAADALRELAR
jgi:hypothetical protein